ncbi:restriction endonuclease subunit S [Candidatus Daviesbacteria bacterium]|nr:restriction endonuclease subunit S [Candidatus Daviesbacteria bacterium]
MKNNWPIKKLGEVCKVFADGDWIESKDQSSSGIRLVQTGNIGRGIFLNKGGKSRFISEQTFKRLNCTEILPGDLLISRLPDPVGRSCIIPDTGTKMVTAVDCTIVRVNEKLILRDFLLLYTNSSNYYTQIQAHLSGTTRKRISRGNLSQIEIPLPPLSEQKKIVAKLEKLLAKVNEAKKLRAKAQEAASQLLPAEFHKIFEEGREKGWEEIDFGDKKYIEIIDGDRGKNYPKKSDFTPEGYCLFLNTSNVRHGSFNFSKCDFISKERDEILRKGKLKRGDVILTTRGTLGNSAFFDDKVPFDNMRINSGMVILRVNEKVLTQRFLLYVLNSPNVMDLIKKANSGSAQPQLPIRVLSKYILYFHPSQSKKR